MSWIFKFSFSPKYKFNGKRKKKKHGVSWDKMNFPHYEAGYTYISTLSTLIPHAVVASSNTTWNVKINFNQYVRYLWCYNNFVYLNISKSFA